MKCYLDCVPGLTWGPSWPVLPLFHGQGSPGSLVSCHGHRSALSRPLHPAPTPTLLTDQPQFLREPLKVSCLHSWSLLLGFFHIHYLFFFMFPCAFLRFKQFLWPSIKSLNSLARQTQPFPLTTFHPWGRPHPESGSSLPTREALWHRSYHDTCCLSCLEASFLCSSTTCPSPPYLTGLMPDQLRHHLFWDLSSGSLGLTGLLFCLAVVPLCSLFCFCRWL